MKKFLSISIVLLFILSGLYLWSPFASDGKEYALEKSVQLDVSASKAFDYLGNSHHASQWSVFVHHIDPLNPESHPDGHMNAMRRCFKNADEKGIAWDEEIVEWKEDKLRTLTIYNLQGFIWKSEGLLTKQKYEPTTSGVRLTFGLYKSTSEVSFWDSLKLRFTGYFISSVFEKNLAGIKRELEK
jgi:hypothetical protein